MNGNKVVTITIAALIALAAVGAAAAGEIGRCYSAELGSAVILPDGSRAAAGELKVCTTARYSPVATLHALYHDGAPLGLFIATVRELEGGADEPAVLVFSRSNNSDELVLEGLAAPNGASARTYLFGTRGRVETHAWFAAARGAGEPGDGWLLVAARAR